MQFTTISTSDLNKHKTECLIVPVPATAKLPKQLSALDVTLQGKLSALIKAGDFSGEIGQTLWLYDMPQMTAERILFVGCGSNEVVTVKQFREILKFTWAAILKTKIKEITSCLHDMNVKNHDTVWAVRETVLSISEACYQFEDFKSKKKPVPTLKKVQFILQDKSLVSKAKTVLLQAEQTASAMKTIKDLAHTPPNVCNPAYLAESAKKLAAKYKNSIKCEVLEEKDMKKLGMNVFLAVSQGSDSPGKLITMEYKGGKAKDAPLVFVGKGLTFDTGGNCIKLPAGMMDMKYDMCGGATVMGIMQFCAEAKLPINVVGVIAAAENMISGRASRLTDVATSMSGLTVEITNTDAEGRLVLCDAMTYAVRKFKPKTMFTIATLTGAAIIALGYETTALMSNDTDTAEAVLAAGMRAEDKAWQLPMFEEYYEHLKSEFADMINANVNRTAGSITAACYLSYFTEGVKWAHLDIAGSSSMPGRQTKATGRPMPLLMEYLLEQTA